MDQIFEHIRIILSTVFGNNLKKQNRTFITVDFMVFCIGLSIWRFVTSVSYRSEEPMLWLLSLVLKFLPVCSIYEAPQTHFY